MKKSLLMLAAIGSLIAISCGGNNDKMQQDSLNPAIQQEKSVGNADSIPVSDEKTGDSATGKDSGKPVSLQEEFESDFPTIKSNLTTFFNRAVLAGGKESQNKRFLQKYCTAALIKKFRVWAEEEGGAGYNTKGMSMCAQDYLDNDHVTSVKSLGNQTAIVNYTEMGQPCSKKVALKKEGDVWKINRYIE